MNDGEYTGPRFLKGGADEYAGTVYTRSGDSMPYTYTAIDKEDADNDPQKYGLDTYGGHVPLTGGNVTQYTWVIPEYGDVYTESTEMVEKMYGEIRGVRHDLAGHIMVIDNLIEEQEYAQAKEYMEGLKNESAGMDTKVKTGNPVTDIILHEKDGEATAEGIRFEADFRFPGTGKVEAFDLSIVLNNALSNAIAGAKESGEKYILLRSWMDNNAYMIEVRNSFGGTLIMDEETGLPLTSKSNKQDHGFGLINIRKIAAKYHGDFMLEQEAGEVCLTVLMMVK